MSKHFVSNYISSISYAIVVIPQLCKSVFSCKCRLQYF